MIDIDVDLWTKKTNDNPVFYVQYAHARLSSLQRSAADLGIVAVRRARPRPARPRTRSRAARCAGRVPAGRGHGGRTARAAPGRPLPEDLAGTYHRFYDSCRVLPQGDEVPGALTDARLWLCEATRIVLANGLGLLGVSAPERM